MERCQVDTKWTEVGGVYIQYNILVFILDRFNAMQAGLSDIHKSKSTPQLKW